METVQRECHSALTVVPDTTRGFSGRKAVDIAECEQPVPVRSLLPLLHHSCAATVVIAVQVIQVRA